MISFLLDKLLVISLLYRVIELKQQSLRNPLDFLFVYLFVCDLFYIFNHYFHYPLYWCKYIDPSVKLHILV